MQNKTGRYFKYAIGEIVLVVIGILIALQINNWNENKKERKLELKILQSIKTDLEKDISNLSLMMSLDSSFMARNSSLISILETKSSIYDSTMEPLFGSINRYGTFYPQKGGYESLKSSGLDILQSDSLRADIVNLYDYQYGYVLETLDLKKQIYLNTNEIFVKELKTTGGPNNKAVSYKEPINFKNLKENSNFINQVRHIYYERINLLDFSKSTLLEMKKTKEKIMKEIKSTNDD